ncbi:MAG: choline dehydrogenase [Deltaproteobacteria bacterium]|nr:MAG: choline dehydrogenase [Deltaproteobacteria bacterium]
MPEGDSGENGGKARALRYARLSSPIEDIQDHYTVVVIGSGYGGAIAASRMARAGQAVCLLERGKERQPGEYPETELETVEEIRVDTPEIHRNGLYDMRLFDDINVLVGCGLGGTSLINANVSIRADPRVFDDERWPRALTADAARLDDGYRRAIEMLRPNPVPERVRLPKLQAMEKSAAAMKAPLARTDINVTFDELPGGVNHVGVEQPPCDQCGDCVTGCNRGSKNTTLMNYLPDAVNHGAEVFTEVEVRRISREPDGTYAVHYRILDAHREGFDAPDESVTADIVVVSAGALGSTEILLRSHDTGLPSSPHIGERFTGNGDVLGFGYNCDDRINGIGWGHRAAEHMKNGQPEYGVGPCITSVIDLRNQDEAVADVNQGMIIEEGSLPGPIAKFLPWPMAAAAHAVGVDTDQGIVDKVRETAREAVSVVGGAYHGAMQNTQTYLVMSHEHSSGQMKLEHDRLQLRWRGIGDEPIFEKINRRLYDATAALGGTFTRNPLWTDAFKHHLITVHPLGGCAMAETAATGVVNHKGQVFSGATGGAVHDGLYVADGSVIPRPLGCNPLLTISALAERTCALIAADRGWTIDYTLPSAPRPRAHPAPDTVGIEFTERMTGHVSTRVVDDFARAEADGRSNGSPFEFVLTIVAEDLDQFVADDRYEAGMVGTVQAPALSAQPLSATQGRFVLAAPDPERVGTRNMRYAMKLTSAEGNHYWFEGTKYIKDDPGLDLWPDTTTLYITVTEGPGPGGAVVGRGILHNHVGDFLRQLRTMRAVNAHGAAQRLGAVARFGAHFVRNLWDVYGGVFGKPTVFDPDAPPRKKRELRAPAPEVHDFAAADGALLRLTRYCDPRGPRKGPVMLAHGLGVSSLIFSIDTIETNLLEYLVERGFDVWLLDFRSSILVPAHRTRYTGDDVARHDFPAAVARVRAVTGAPSVQVVAHCFGATTFTMAMLAGLEGVRSAVISQISTHVYTPALTRIKTGLHVPEVLDALGVESLTAYVDSHANWKERLLDAVLRLYPTELEERCASKVCHRIALLYAPLYEHDQLNPATHDAMHEMFGDASISAFEHLGRLSNTRHLVGADGSEIYMDKLRRLAIPIAFIHGAENACFLPRSTEETVAALSQANRPELYQRHLIPGYGHIDCIFGKNAARDVYPHIAQHLEATR